MRVTAVGDTIYVVDDNADLRDSLRELLESFSRNVRTFEFAGDFLRVVQFSPCNCALVDICIPDMDGFGIVDALASLKINIPIVLMTGHGELAQKAQRKYRGTAAVLTKPIGESSLLDALCARARKRSRTRDERTEADLRRHSPVTVAPRHP